MKQTLLIIIIGIVFTTNAFAQSFLQDNKVWCIYELPCEENQPNTKYYKIEGDTLIDSEHYKRISYAKNSNEFIISGTLLHEADGVIYSNSAYNLKENILYDFNLKVGDYYYEPLDQEFLEHPYIVDSIVIRNVLGEDRKHWYFSLVEWEESPLAEVWIEGIGSLTGPFRPIGWKLAGAIEKLICVHEGETQLYQSPDFTGCDANTLAAPVIKKSQNLINLHSKGDGIIKLQLKDGSKGEICLFGIDGRKVTVQKITSVETQISLPTKGLVFYRFINNIGEIQTGKVVVR